MAQRKIPAPERLKLWVRSGGRCQLCRRYLLEGQLSSRELTFGEAAHIVGQQATERSPRGLSDELTAEERDNADNLMLICDDEHTEIDKFGSRNDFTVEFLREMKREHEEMVMLATSFGNYNRTTPIRMVGWLRDRPLEVGRDAVATAVMTHAGRMPRFDLSNRNMIEIDLRGLPGEEGPTAAYYSSACASIDKIIKNKIAEAISNEEIIHLSVFAFARLPLLVYLGSQLDDSVPVDIYQKHRTTGDWKWPVPAAVVDFSVEVGEGSSEHDELVVLINISGTINSQELPESMRGLPICEIGVKQLAHPDVFAGPQVLDAFGSACRRLLASLEKVGNKSDTLLHVFAAMPVSAAVEFGRVFANEVHPSIQLYDRTSDGEYVAAIQIGKQ